MRTLKTKLDLKYFSKKLNIHDFISNYQRQFKKNTFKKEPVKKCSKRHWRKLYVHVEESGEHAQHISPEFESKSFKFFKNIHMKSSWCLGDR